MQNKANLKLRYLLSIKQHSEMNIFCLKQGLGLKASGLHQPLSAPFPREFHLSRCLSG